MLSTRNPPQNKRSTKTENEGWKKNIPSKWTFKKSCVAILIPHKIDFKKNDHKKRQRRILHNT